MSINAHKIEKYSDHVTFNLWHDDLLMQLLEDIGGLAGLNVDGCGLIEVNEDMLAQMRKDLDDKTNVSEEEIVKTKTLLKEIEKEFDPQFKYVVYYCF